MRTFAYLASTALGLMVTGVGIVLLLAPDTAAMLYGLPTAANPVWQHVAGTRELSAGFLLLALVASRQDRALGYAMLALSPIPLGDFILAVQHGAGLWSLQHAPGVPGMLFIAWILLKKPT
jgi:hypothetical protein